MNLTYKLNEFNRHFADELISVFPRGVATLQADDGSLLFRGPDPRGSETVIVTHASICLEPAVVQALAAATPEQRAELVSTLTSNLGTQLRARYDSENIGRQALKVVGTMSILQG